MHVQFILLGGKGTTVLLWHYYKTCIAVKLTKLHCVQISEYLLPDTVWLPGLHFTIMSCSCDVLSASCPSLNVWQASLASCISLPVWYTSCPSLPVRLGLFVLKLMSLDSVEEGTAVTQLVFDVWSEDLGCTLHDLTGSGPMKASAVIGSRKLRLLPDSVNDSCQIVIL